MHSPFAHVLFTNYSPSEAEAVRIREFCSEPEAELARLSSEISRLQQALDNLISQRDEIQDVVDSHRALLHPIRNVPPEIIQHIFVLCLDAKRNPVMHESEAPLLLGRICRSWREICMGTAELWSSIHIVAPDVSENAKGMTNNATRTMVDRVVDWLDRSGELPLSISLHVPPPPRYPSTSDDISPSAEILKLISTYCRRWRRVALDVPSANLNLNSLADLVGSLPLLESFSYHNTTAAGLLNHNEDALPRAFPFPETAPRLHQLSLLNCQYVHPLRMSWSQITELRVGGYIEMWDEIIWLQVLEACTVLRRCALSYTPREAIVVERRRLTLPQLHSLRIQAIVMGNLPPTRCVILDYLTLPGLRELQTYGHPNLEIVPVINNLLTRSPCSLARLHVGENGLQIDDLRTCFDLLPELRELSFTLPPSVVWNQARETLSALSPLSGQVLHMCPKLQKIVIYGIFSRDLETITSFIHSRMNPVPGVIRMTSIHLHFTHLLEDGERAKIEEVGQMHSVRVGFRAETDPWDVPTPENAREVEKSGEEIVISSPQAWVGPRGQETSRWAGLQDDDTTDIVSL